MHKGEERRDLQGFQVFNEVLIETRIVNLHDAFSPPPRRALPTKRLPPPSQPPSPHTAPAPTSPMVMTMPGCRHRRRQPWLLTASLAYFLTSKRSKRNRKSRRKGPPVCGLQGVG